MLQNLCGSPHPRTRRAHGWQTSHCARRDTKRQRSCPRQGGQRHERPYDYRVVRQQDRASIACPTLPGLQVSVRHGTAGLVEDAGGQPAQATLRLGRVRQCPGEAFGCPGTCHQRRPGFRSRCGGGWRGRDQSVGQRPGCRRDFGAARPRRLSEKPDQRSTLIVTVEQHSVVDAAGVDTDGGDVVLTISDHLPWDEVGEHLRILQGRTNCYLGFIESGGKSSPRTQRRRVAESQWMLC